MNVRAVVGASILLASTLASVPASADVQACLSASEKGQRARSAGKLREARDLFLVCGSEGCPAMVRRDCSQWQGELITMLPSVVFGAKDKQGRDLFDVTVSMDGETLSRKLDGKSVNVDPGPHTFRFEIAGSPPVIERALVKEGEKTRVIAVTFNDGSGPAATADAAAAPPVPRDHARETPAEARGHTVYPWIVVGLGAATMVAGAVVILASPSLPAGCNATTKTCTRGATESAADFASRQEDAGRSEAQPTEGLVVGAIGLGVLAGGLLWHFLEPTDERRSGALRVTPWASRATAGGSVGFSF